MKRRYLLIVLCLIISTIFTFNFIPNDNNILFSQEIYAVNIQSDNSFTINNIANYTLCDKEFVVYGNYSDFDEELLYTLTHDDSKITIFYDVNINDNINQNLEILRNNAVIYYYKNGIPHVHSYISNSTNDIELINDISDYVSRIIKKAKDDTYITAAHTRSGEVFEILYSGSFRKDQKPYGYIDCDYTVRKYRVNDVSSLYLVESDFAFTPGRIARDLGDTRYDTWYNSSGYAKIKARRAEHEVGYDQIRYGGTPIFKDAFPINGAGTVSITSSYTNSLNIGFSYTGGFSLTNINFDIEGSQNVTYDYTYSKNYTNTEPALSAQKDPADIQKYTWLYTYSMPRNETFHLESGYMFEMNNRGHDLYEGDLALRFEYRMTVNNSLNPDTGTEYLFSGYTFHNYY